MCYAQFTPPVAQPDSTKLFCRFGSGGVNWTLVSVAYHCIRLQQILCALDFALLFIAPPQKNAAAVGLFPFSN